MSWLQRTRNGKYASAADRFPVARVDDLVVEDVGEELLIYDKTTNRGHCLSATAAKVWRACDGYTSTDVLGTGLDLDPETLAQVLDELDSNSLLRDTPQNGQTRREMTAKAAKLGAAASIPFIYSVLAPVPAAAATPTPRQCEHYSSGNCGSANCAAICGCCCCCTGCSIQGGPPGASCKVCYPAGLCPVNVPCPSTSVTNGCTTPGGSGCSVAGPGCVPPCTPGFAGDACAAAFDAINGNPCP